MNWLIFHIAGGDAFFTGVVLLAIAVILSGRKTRWMQSSGSLLCVFGMIVIAVSATPLPYWLYALAGFASLFWLISIGGKEASRLRRRIADVLMCGVWLIAVAMEIPYHISPRVEFQPASRIVIYGDSITAGMGEGEAVTWPKLLVRDHGMNIRDNSHMGATAASALKKAKAEKGLAKIAILEIGGNDLLGRTTVAEFAVALDQLLELLASRHETVLMFELPLPPFHNSFGRVQRRLADKHAVKLIPRRVLMGILADDGATLDSIHLTQSGQNQMAAAVRRILGQ